jgi:peptidoglycan/LPS O-acetylase OafA/YrhL
VPAAHARFLDVRYFGSLDGLRALSVLAVVWHHTAGTGRTGLAGRGSLGVEFFFAISGFLITTLLLRERDRYGRISLRDFYARRTLRIFPLYYATLALYVGLTLATSRRSTPSGQAFLADLPAFLTYTSNWFVGSGDAVTFYFAWSLATEEQFYLFWPPLLVLLMTVARGRFAVPVVALLALLAVDAVVTALTAEPRGLPVVVLVSLATPILAGAALAVVLHAPAGFRAVAPALGWRWTPLVLLLLVLVLAPVDDGLVLVGLVMSLVVASCCVREDHVLAPLLRWAPLRWTGVISYGVYLLHQLAANLVEAGLGLDEGPLLFVATVPVTLLAAWLSYRFFETPVLRYKRRFERGPSAVGPRTGEPLTAGRTTTPTSSGPDGRPHRRGR